VTPLITELTAPALFIAGASTSLHCALMCGAINAAQVRSQGPVPLRQTLLLVHGGRVLGYALLGLLAGALGARLALWLPETLAGRGLQLLAALALIAAGVQHWKKGVRSNFPAKAGPCHASRKMDLTPFLPPRGRLFAQGLLWALMPCGILYTVVMLAALSASALAGFLLLAAFGLGTVPLMGVSGGMLGLATRPQHARGLRRASGAVLIGLGLAGALLVIVAPGVLPAWLCQPQA
jgi:hypothetical protein